MEQKIAYDNGINIPKILCSIGSYKISQWIDGIEVLHLINCNDIELKKEIILKIVEQNVRLNSIMNGDLYLVNADLNMGNFIWTYNREVFMIDVESLKFTKNPDQYLYKLLLKRIVHKDLILVYLEEYSKYKNVDSIIKECEKRNWRWK